MDKHKKTILLLYASIVGFSCWMISELLEIIQHGYSPTVYYLTAIYHFLAGFGVWGLYKKQTQTKNVFNTISAAIASISYLTLTYFPILVMNSGLSFTDFFL